MKGLWQRPAIITLSRLESTTFLPRQYQAEICSGESGTPSHVVDESLPTVPVTSMNYEYTLEILRVIAKADSILRCWYASAPCF